MGFLVIRKLRLAMVEKGIGVCQLAKISGLQQSGISRWLKCEKVSCRLPTISRIAEALDVEPVDLMEGA